MTYITKIDDGFGFKDSRKDEILSTDVKMIDEVYNKFIEMNGLGNEFKLGDINGETFERMFIELIPEVFIPVKTPTTLYEIQSTLDTILMSLL